MHVMDLTRFRQQRTVQESDANELRQMIEMLVACVKREIVLKHQRSQPEIIGGNGRALFSQLSIERRIVMRRLIIGEQHAHALRHQKPTKDTFVFDLSPPMSKTCSELPEYDERQDDDIGGFQDRNGVVDALAEIDVSIRVERNSHRQRLSSI